MVFSFSEDCFLTFQSSVGLLCQNLEQQKQFLFYILYVFFYIEADWDFKDQPEQLSPIRLAHCALLICLYGQSASGYVDLLFASETARSDA